MEQITPTRYFLGANSVRGFSSLYDSFTDPAAGEFLWVIKGGPGCGKSTFMKKLGAAAERAGQAVEYIHCSGDPDSLDAVWFPALRTGYVDGTAPHATVTKAHFSRRCSPASYFFLKEKVSKRTSIRSSIFAIPGFPPGNETLFFIRDQYQNFQ